MLQPEAFTCTTQKNKNKNIKSADVSSGDSRKLFDSTGLHTTPFSFSHRFTIHNLVFHWSSFLVFYALNGISTQMLFTLTELTLKMYHWNGKPNIKATCKPLLNPCFFRLHGHVMTTIRALSINFVWPITMSINSKLVHKTLASSVMNTNGNRPLYKSLLVTKQTMQNRTQPLFAEPFKVVCHDISLEEKKKTCQQTN